MKLFDIIKYEGDNSSFVWKHPAEDFNTLSQLIVHQSQEAILFRDGQALDVFGPGRHTLHTKNIPLLCKLVNLPFDGVSPFHCEVYFVNKTMPLDMKWGTRTQIVVQDPKFNILLHAGANGGMGVQIRDSKTFLTKLVGTTESFEKEAIINYFREVIAAHVKTYLTNVMSQVSFVTVNTKLDEMSAAMHAVLGEEMNEFGIQLIKFFISSIQIDKDDYEKIQTALANAGAMGITATAEKNRMDVLGYTWADQEMSEIMKAFASNEGSSSSLGGMMAQLPLAAAFGEMIRDKTADSFFHKQNTQRDSSGGNEEQRGIFCVQCGKKNEQGAKFCSNCGMPVTAASCCTKCGRTYKEEEQFCPACGTKKGIIEN